MASPEKKEIAISVKDLHKSFRLPKEHSSELKHAFINFVRGIKGYKELHVLRGISFDIEKGDFIGIVGRNGSGKSTLLKILAGVYEPDHGSVEINGSLVPFIELGVGFNPELTGRENVYMNGAMLGFSNDEVDKMYNEIVDFAELHEFMDQKLKNYSSGMQVRLAFSIAIRAQADILVLDEVLAVGDEAFQRKCNNYFEKIRKDEGKTIVLVTHSMEAVRKYCNKAVMIEKGHVVILGNPEDVANQYSLENLQAPTANQVETKTLEKDLGVKNVVVKLLSPKIISQKDDMLLRISYELTRDRNTFVDISIFDIDKNIALLRDKSQTIAGKKSQTVVVEYESDAQRLLNDSNLQVWVAVWDAQTSERIAYTSEKASPAFLLRRDNTSSNKITGTTKGVINVSGKWKIE
jgi:ABC-2 type transport system ATP-binding protein